MKINTGTGKIQVIVPYSQKVPKVITTMVVNIKHQHR